MLERADHAGVWGLGETDDIDDTGCDDDDDDENDDNDGNESTQEPEATAEEIEASAKIDAQLRADRVKQIKEECAVVILGPNSDASNAARWQLTAQVGTALGVKLDAESEDTPQGSAGDAVVTGTLGDGSVVTVTSFPTSKKKKASRIRMSVADPSVLIFVVEAETNTTTSTPGDAAATLVSTKALEKSLSHLLFTAASIGDLKQTAVCLVVANCAELKSSLRQMDFASNEEFCAAVGTNLPETAAAKTPEDFLLSLSGELEKAALSFDPTEVRTVFVEESLAGAGDGKRSGGVSDGGSHRQTTSLTQQILGLLSDIQGARVAEAEAMDMESEVMNVVPRRAVDEVVASTSVSTSSLWNSSLVKLAALGAVSAVLVVVAMQALDRADDRDSSRY
ncbi:Hypothetical Protein FCC1311_097662 [Hondaea fermentalgiana]|uniref:Uncharacterized protein n=1 Tax=Hondaea fermentalgiana TaxID=2315210 RepID=A0A2R5GXV5_9STRA|nr:Hypothetical Protein FCC1311_097662 [Hondaea fermentalgiana]|eukprot:GBG33543.1 Hypothetical Protein FCC1311_097662 [Hondaea fermentalgiana]